MFAFWMPRIGRKWKNPKSLIVLFVLEVAGSVAALALFGIASPDLYRTRLWQIGSDGNFNSSPKRILYAYANYQPIPKTPFVWSQALTDFNVAISVLSMFIMIVKIVMFSLHVWYPLLGLITNAVLVGLYAASAYGQAGPDKSDPKHPSSVAWYITGNCDLARPSGAKGYCLQAKGAFATTIIMIAIFLANLILAIWAMISTAAQRAADKIDIDEMQLKGGNGPDTNFEMKPVKTTTVPFTPRTLAFNTLDRQLPLRSQQIDKDKEMRKAPQFT